MEFVSLNDLLQIGIFLVGYTALIFSIVSFFQKKK